MSCETELAHRPNNSTGHVDGIKRLLTIMVQLRDKENGCPWDLEQDFSSLTSSVLEEAYEVVDAVRSKENQKIEEELGDLLFAIIFYAQIGSETGAFSFNSIAQLVAEKMIRRHPHIFADGEKVASAQQQRINWEQSKNQEHKGTQTSIFQRLTWGLPALSLANKANNYDPGLGDAKSSGQVFNLQSELQDIIRKIKSQRTNEDMEELFGSLLYEVTRLASSHAIDPELALRNYIQSKVKSWDSNSSSDPHSINNTSKRDK